MGFRNSGSHYISRFPSQNMPMWAPEGQEVFCCGQISRGKKEGVTKNIHGRQGLWRARGGRNLSRGKQYADLPWAQKMRLSTFLPHSGSLDLGQDMREGEKQERCNVKNLRGQTEKATRQIAPPGVIANCAHTFFKRSPH